MLNQKMMNLLSSLMPTIVSAVAWWREVTQSGDTRRLLFQTVDEMGRCRYSACRPCGQPLPRLSVFSNNPPIVFCPADSVTGGIRSRLAEISKRASAVAAVWEWAKKTSHRSDEDRRLGSHSCSDYEPPN